jgi:uncharacterized protein YqgC (DUF456 family)
MDTGGLVLIALAMVVGLVGTALPLIPGLPIVWLAALVYGLGEGFGTSGTIAFAIITLLAVGGIVGGIVLPHRHVAAKGAERSSVLAGAIGAIVGFFVIPVIGLIIGAVVGIYAMEYRRTGDGGAAWSTTKTLLVGFGLGVLLELSAGILMVAVWVGWVLAD